MEACFGAGPVCSVRLWRRELVLVGSGCVQYTNGMQCHLQNANGYHNTSAIVSALLSLSRTNWLGCIVLCLSQGVSESFSPTTPVSGRAQSMCHDVNFKISNMTSPLHLEEVVSPRSSNALAPLHSRSSEVMSRLSRPLCERSSRNPSPCDRDFLMDGGNLDPHTVWIRKKNKRRSGPCQRPPTGNIGPTQREFSFLFDFFFLES